MIKKARARFAGGVITLLEPLDLEEGAELLVTVEVEPAAPPGETAPAVPGNREDVDIAAIGKAMYEKMRVELEKTRKGKMYVVDVLSGDYEIGDDDLTTTLRLLERRPGALTWGELIGYPAPYFMGDNGLPSPVPRHD